MDYFLFELCAIPGRSHYNLFNKDTRESFILYILCFVPVIIINYLFIIIHYLFICACYLLSFFIYFCSCPILIYSLFNFCSLFIVQKRKDSILILDCVLGISILCTTTSMRVNKHHTADCTDFVLV